MQYKGLNNQIYAEGHLIGEGGEGSVYAIAGYPGFVAKIYSQAFLTHEKEEKLKAMLAFPIKSDQVAWPVDILYSDGKFAGFVMPAVKGYVPLNYLYATDDKKYNLDLSNKITLARNLCVAINAVHKAGQVCGDLNPKNIMADPNTGKIMLVDTDSFHITGKNGKIYRCIVGLGSYFPAELLAKFNTGNTLAMLPLPTFTKESDLFALAGHIFRLLMGGYDPFSCALSPAIRQQSVACPQPEDNILKGRFPFVNPVPGSNPPPLAPEFSYLPQNVQEMFKKAFLAGYSDPKQRPDAEEWHSTLETMLHGLKTCGNNGTHKYPGHLAECPWCKIENAQKQIVANAQTVAQQNTMASVVNRAANNPAQKPAPYTAAAQNTQKASYKQPAKNNLMAMHYVICSVIAFIALIAQIIWQQTAGMLLTGELFGYAYSYGIFSFWKNAAIWLHPWGYYIAAIIGIIIYLASIARRRRDYRYAVLCAFAGPAIIKLVLLLGVLIFWHPIATAVIAIIAIPVIAANS